MNDITLMLRGERNCRQKLRRLGREFIRAAQELDIGL